MRYWLDEGVTLRIGPREALLFRPRDGLRVRLNPTGGLLLAALDGRTLEEAWDKFTEDKDETPEVPDEGALQVLGQCREMGLLSHQWQESARMIHHGDPPPPEVVHLLVTDSCNLACPSCYAGNEANADELTLAELKELIDRLADLGVLELAIGGGEPLLRPDLEALVAHASGKMVVNVTTNGSVLDLERARRLKDAGVNLVQVSVNGPDEATNAISRQADTFKAACEALASLELAGIRRGVNIVVTRNLLGRLSETLAFFARYRPHQYVLVRPKPRHAEDAWFAAHSLRPADYPVLVNEVRALPRQFPSTIVTVDSTFGPLFHDVSPNHLARHGFKGLAGGVSSFCIAADGSVYPGSHFTTPEFRAGNIREAGDTIETVKSASHLANIWEQAEVMSRFRAIPDSLTGACAVCPLQHICNGGCRKTAFVENENIKEGDRYCVRAG